ncbi:MAG: hypothetical protein KAT15_16760, partial [Bacteroidales bacterium]|nr:hypothetical protein [Bacteroidales bacterium]
LADSLKLRYDEWFSPLCNVSIPPIPVGYSDSVVIPAHEGFLTGEASYYWSDNGWSNDWVHRLDNDNSSIYWNLEVAENSTHDCFIHYASREGSSAITLDCSGERMERELPAFIPVIDKNYSRIDRSAEAIGQTWKRMSMGEIQLQSGSNRLTLNASNNDLEVLSVILIRK